MSPAPFAFEALEAALPEYEIRDVPLGQGADKIAYKANKDARDVVVKVLTEPMPEDLDSLDTLELPDRIGRELAGMSNVQSPHVVSLLEKPSIARLGNRSYLWYVEPYYPGGTLEEAIEKSQAGARLGQTVLAAMLRAIDDMWNQARIVHRDIKPGNIVLDNDQNPILLDLGIAFHSELTELTDAMGVSPRTPRYAAPEQFELRRLATIDFRTDLFLTGLVAYEAYTGRHPYFEVGIDTATYLNRLASGAPGVDDLLRAGCSERHARLVVRLLAGRPSGRFRTVALARRMAGEG